MPRNVLCIIAALVTAASSLIWAQTNRPLSPRGTASVHVSGRWVRSERQTFTMGGERYEGGMWIDIDYGRPLLRGRRAFAGTGASFGKDTYAGAPVWRAGADVSTRLKTTIPLMIGDKRVPAGEYSLFIEFHQPTDWTLIVSNWAAAPRFDSPITEGLFGAFSYTPDKDVTRVAMKVEAVPYRVEQLTWSFVEMTDVGGRMAITWDNTIASAPFSFVRE